MTEKLRVQVVKQFVHLELKNDRELQRIIEMAAKVCGAPVSAISLVDKETQWIKIEKGLGITQTPRKLSFCTHVIKRTGLLVVNDTRQDARFSKYPNIQGGHRFRFYAGAPLITREGVKIGALCVLDYKPRALTAEQKFIFKILSKNAVSIMELKLSLAQLEDSFTHLKLLRENTSGAAIKLRAMFESLTDRYFLLGKQEEIIDFNRTAYNFVKDMYGGQLTYGCMMIDFLNPSYKELFTLNYNKALKGEKIELERLADYGLKGKIWWDCVFEPVRSDDDEIIGVSYVARNINERKINEEKIIAQNRLLIKIAQIQSHDYRGPVASILGLMNFIKEDGYVASKEYLLMMETAVQKLDEKIQEVVNIANDKQLMI